MCWSWAMDKLYIGMVTFGNLPYTRMAIQSLMETASPPAEFVVVVGKPGDEETVSYLDGIPEENEEGDSIIILKRHPTNLDRKSTRLTPVTATSRMPSSA